jgi:hypothetical protein
VNLLNQVDASYRRDLQGAFELNYARFDAKLELRFAQADAKTEQRFVQYEAKFEQRFAQYEAKFEQRFSQLDAKMEERFTRLMSEISALRIDLAAVNARIDAKVDRGDFEAALRKQTWLVIGAMASIFVGTAIPLVGLWLK